MTNASNLRTAILALGMVLAWGCGGDDNGGGAAGTGTAGTGTAGTSTAGTGTAGTGTAGTGGAGAGGMGGMGGGGGSSVMCGTATCTGSGFVLMPCCVDAATSTCGLENPLFQIECGVPGTPDPNCPNRELSFMGTNVTLTGCCTADGVCGGFAMGSPCTEIPDLGDDDAGMSMPIACGGS